MIIHFLGTNGWYATETGNTICILIDTKNFYLILDAGDGFYKINQYLLIDKPIYLFLSHVHLDHIIGLHTLNKFKFKRRLELYGYKGTKISLEKILNPPFSAPFKKLPYIIEFNELIEKKYEKPLNFDCKLLSHNVDCLGYRFIINSKIITYCTDTGTCDSLYQLANGANLLICECSYKSKQKTNWPHLTPKEAAKIAKDSDVDHLVLTHFDANVYRSIEEREQAEKKAKKIFEDTTISQDGLKIEL